MKNVLYVDCCIRREGSRTKELAEHFLKELEKTGEYAITGLVLMDEGLNFMAEGFFRQRDELLAGKNFAHPRFSAMRTSLRKRTKSPLPPPSGI